MSAPVVQRLGRTHVDAVAACLADAFHDYAVMRHTLGDSPAYAGHLATLVRFFVMARVVRAEPILGVWDGDLLAGAALVSHPENTESPPALALLREQVWSTLGTAARLRYEELGTVWRTFEVEAPHLHLNMIGVRRDRQRRGTGRALLDAVHRLAEETPAAEGVTLTTEDPVNVALYRHLGYEVIAEQPLGSGLCTWGMYRPLTTGRRPPA